ncbi:hypothetical protein JCM1840_000783 [Sporobolomyces johnsonii]
MQALLLSPATRFSPDSSSSLSPATPPLPSLAFLDQPPSASPTGTFDTPTHPRSSTNLRQSTIRDGVSGIDAVPTPKTPAWLTDELDQEWLVESDDDDADTGHGTSVDPQAADTSSTSIQARRTSIQGVTSTQPRVPSSLRYGFNANTSITTTSSLSQTDDPDLSNEQGASFVDRSASPSASPNASTGTEGTFVYNSVVVNSDGRGGEAGEQLQAAVRALKGSGAGLFAERDGEALDDGAEGARLVAPKVKAGLLSLFEPPSPPEAVSLPKSTRPAPSLPSFSFSPPQAAPSPPGPSHPTPHFSTPPSDHDPTPVARQPRFGTPYGPSTPAADGEGGTPSHPLTGAAGRGRGPLPPTNAGRKERFLHRSAALPPHPSRAQDTPASSANSSATARHLSYSAHSASELDADTEDFASARSQAVTVHFDRNDTTSGSEEEEEGLSDDDGQFLPLDLPASSSSSRRSSFSSGDGEFTSEDDEPRAPAASSSRPAYCSLAPLPLHIPSTSSQPFQFPSASHSPNASPLPPPPPSPLRLFQPTYDTYTRTHLAHIVDDLVDNNSYSYSYSDPEAEGGGAETSEEGFLGHEGASRSSKRIKLSPREDVRAALEEVSERKEEEEEAGEDEEGEATPIRPTSERRRRTPRSSERRRRDQRERRGTLTLLRSGRSIHFSPLTGGTPTPTRAPVQEESENDPPKTVGRARARERFTEANEIMERIRRRTEEREERKRGMISNGEKEGEKPANSPALRSSRPPSPSSSPEHEADSDAPPPLPHLAAAASASLRSALSNPSSPLPSPARPTLIRSTSTSASVGLGLANGGLRLPSTLAAASEKGGSIGRRHFARTPIGAKNGRRGKRMAAFDAAAWEESEDDEDAQEDGEGEDELPSLPALPVPTPSFASSAVSSAIAPTPVAKPTHARHPSITTIHPSSLDAQRLLATAGSAAQAKGMTFDQESRRWIRTPRRVAAPSAHSLPEAEEEGEEQDESDPFRDFSELKSPASSSAAAPTPAPASTSIAPAVLPSPASTASRADLDALPRPGDGSGSLKAADLLLLSGLGITKGTPPLLAPPKEDEEKVVEKSPEGRCYFEAPPTEEERREEEGPLLTLEEDEEDSATWGRGESSKPQPSPPRQSASAPALSPATGPPATPAPSSRSAPPSRSNSTPFPRSALKPSSRAHSDPLAFASTPRSVSFSDGKTSGKIEGLVPLGFAGGSRLKFEMSASTAETTASGIGGGPGELELDETAAGQRERTLQPEEQGGASFARKGEVEKAFEDALDATPKARARTLPPTPAEPTDTSLVLSSLDSFAPSVRPRPSSANTSRSRTFSRTPASGTANATFLTECSFGVSHDRLLQFITDVEPFEPDWEGLRSIDLSGKRAESVVRMKEFLPRLDEVNLNNNEISYLTGIPSTLRTLLIAANRITSLTSFHHLLNLERLDLSNNQLDSVHQLGCLRHLRDLKADGNRIESLEGLAELDGLVRLSLKGNSLKGEVDLAGTKWTRLETLYLARNKISSLRGLERLSSLTSLNLDHNALPSLSPSATLPRLRVLRLCNNPITELDVAFAPKLRTLYVDSARLGAVTGTEELRKLENLSVRDQSGGALTLAMHHIRDVKRLYLSGNPLPTSFPSGNEQFFNLVYLELAMCQLTSLPANLAALVPNVRVLNLDYNFVDDLEPLRGLARLNKLSVVGNRLTKTRPVVGVVGSLAELESVDLRMNPFTLALYPPLGPTSSTLVPSHHEHRILHPSSLPSPSPPPSPPRAPVPTPSTGSDYLALDTKFRRALPDAWYFKRKAYRAAVLEAVPGLAKLDGVDVGAKERKGVGKVLERLARARKQEGARGRTDE